MTAHIVDMYSEYKYEYKPSNLFGFEDLKSIKSIKSIKSRKSIKGRKSINK